MDNERDEIKDIVAQLKRLQIQETELLQRLEQLSQADRNPSRSPDTTRGFAIRDLVQMKNPRPLQAKKGTITKIGVATDQIVAQAKNGSKTVGASSNTFHVEQLQSWLKPTRNHLQPAVIPRKGGITSRGNHSMLPRPTRRDRKNSKEERTSWMVIIWTALAMDSLIDS
jgi:hypothetical protein